MSEVIVSSRSLIRQHPEYKIIDSFCPEKLLGCKIFDFVWQVFPRQRWIIDRWAKHFRACGEAYLITTEVRRNSWDSDRRGNHTMLRLWKKLEVGDHASVMFDREVMERWNNHG